MAEDTNSAETAADPPAPATETSPTAQATRAVGHAPGARPTGRAERARRIALRLAHLGLAVFLFILSIELMKRGGQAVAPKVEGGFFTENALSTLGTGQFLAYVFLSGKPVAAFALALFAHGGLTRLQTFTMLSGGRLGAAFIVLLVGFLYSLRSGRRRESVGVGVVALVLTSVVYLPGMVVGYAMLKSGWLDRVRITLGDVKGLVQLVWGPVVDLLNHVFPTWTLLPLGGFVIVFAVKLLDRVLPNLEGSARSSRETKRLRRPAVMFALGFVVTLVTFSVSVALTVLVPLTARGYLRREESFPYIMGSNVATLADTLLVAVLVGNPIGVRIVLAEAIGVALVTAVLLTVVYRPLSQAILGFDAWVVATSRRLWSFVAALLAFPLLMLLAGALIGPPAH